MTDTEVYIGTAGWALPAGLHELFHGDGTILEHYSRVLNCVEINSSFYREHQSATYSKWAKLVPSTFRFSVKLNRLFTQVKRLNESGDELKESIDRILHLNEKLGVILVQLPPSLKFDATVADRFFLGLRKYYRGPVAFEPRHASWAASDALAILAGYGITKVRADPERVPVALEKFPAIERFLYLRFHGMPEIYKSQYDRATLKIVARIISSARESSRKAWCIFDNTTFGHATANALELAAAFEKA